MMNRLIIKIAVICTVIVLLMPMSLAQEGYNNISPEQVMARLDSGDDVFLLDVRTMEEYLEGHIGNAILIIYLRSSNELDSEHIGDLPSDKSMEILIYCRSGARSALSSEILVEMGYDNVWNMEGGILEWTYGFSTDTPPNYASEDPGESEGSEGSEGTDTPMIVMALSMVAGVTALVIVLKKKKGN